MNTDHRGKFGTERHSKRGKSLILLCHKRQNTSEILKVIHNYFVYDIGVGLHMLQHT